MFGILPRHVLFYSYDVDGVLSILYTGFTQPAALARSVAHWPVELEVAALIPDQGCQRCCGGGHCLHASSFSTEFKGPIKRHGIEQFLTKILSDSDASCVLACFLEKLCASQWTIALRLSGEIFFNAEIRAHLDGSTLSRTHVLMRLYSQTCTRTHLSIHICAYTHLLMLAGP